MDGYGLLDLGEGAIAATIYQSDGKKFLAWNSRYKHMLENPQANESHLKTYLEAMAHETSIVVFNVSSIPEIAGQAAIYVDPVSGTSITQGLTRALSEIGTIEEKKRLELGKKRVALFSWDTAAKQVLSVLESVGNQSK